MLTHPGGGKRRLKRASSCQLLSLISPRISTAPWVPETDSTDLLHPPSGLTSWSRFFTPLWQKRAAKPLPGSRGRQSGLPAY